MSYEIAATGLNAVNEQLDGISNNIANAGTVGYKSMPCMPEARRWASAWRAPRKVFRVAVRWSPPAMRSI